MQLTSCIVNLPHLRTVTCGLCYTLLSCSIWHTPYFTGICCVFCCYVNVFRYSVSNVLWMLISIIWPCRVCVLKSATLTWLRVQNAKEKGLDACGFTTSHCFYSCTLIANRCGICQCRVSFVYSFHIMSASSVSLISLQRLVSEP